MGRRILVVDDDRDIAEAMTDVLAEGGYDVQRACDGLEALDLLRRAAELPELIVLDLRMPRLDGGEFRERQLGDPRIGRIPVVLVSADGGARERSRAMRVAEYLPKPLGPDDLLRAVARVLGMAAAAPATLPG